MSTYKSIGEFAQLVGLSANKYIESNKHTLPTHVFVSPSLNEWIQTCFIFENPYHFGHAVKLVTLCCTLEIKVVPYWEEDAFIVGTEDELTTVIERYILQDG